MRVINNRNEFLKNYKNFKINEALANEINWGDSLLGRLINSTIRKASIANNLRNINGLLENLETEFDRLSELIKISGESINIVNKIIYKTEFSQHLKDIEESISDGDSIDELIKLTSDKIQTVKSNKTIYDDVESLRKEFVSLLEKFIEFLEGLKNPEEDKNLDLKSDEKSEDDNSALKSDEKSEDDNSALKSGEEKSDNEKNILALDQGNTDVSKSSKYEIEYQQISTQIDKLIENINKISSEKSESVESNEFIKIKRELWKKLHPDNSKKIIPQEVRLTLSKKLSDIARNNDIKSIKEFKEKIDLLIKKYSDLNLKNKAKDIYTKLVDVHKKNNSGKAPSAEEEVEIRNKVEKMINESVITKYDRFIENIQNNMENKILEKFEEIFSEFKDIELQIENPDELKDKVKESKEKQIPIDPVIEIVRLFNRAYRIHTPGVIPSGRSGGKVSNSVFREYEYIGSGSGGSADAPGSGPYRNIKLFDKWREGVFSIINKSKYQEIFNENTSFKIGDADRRKNVTKDSLKVKQGGGKTLLTFINSMLNSSDGYRSGAQAKFIAEYFNVKLDDKEFNSPGFSDTPKNEENSNKIEDSLKFEKDRNIEFKNNYIYRIPKSIDRFYYLRVIESKDGTTYLLFSLGNPFDLTIEGLDPIDEKNNLIFAKTNSKFIYTGFKLESANFINEDGKMGDEWENKFDSNGLQNAEVLKRGNKISNKRFNISSDTHKEIWNKFSKEYKDKYDIFFKTA